MYMSFAADVGIGISGVGRGGLGEAFAISEPKKVSIFRAHLFQWPSKSIFPHGEGGGPGAIHVNNKS